MFITNLRFRLLWFSGSHFQLEHFTSTVSGPSKDNGQGLCCRLIFGRSCADLSLDPAPPTPSVLPSVPASEICPVVCSLGTCPDRLHPIALKCHAAPVKNQSTFTQLSPCLRPAASWRHTFPPPQAPHKEKRGWGEDEQRTECSRSWVHPLVQRHLHLYHGSKVTLCYSKIALGNESQVMTYQTCTAHSE